MLQLGGAGEGGSQECFLYRCRNWDMLVYSGVLSSSDGYICVVVPRVSLKTSGGTKTVHRGR